MRWTAVALVLLNLGLWIVASNAVPPRMVAAHGAGTLPRVADLRMESPGAPAEERKYCVRLGWFESEQAAMEAYHRLTDEEVPLLIRETNREVAPLYWIIIPPQPPAQALGEFREIQRRGIDSYLVTEGENKNAISLGLFESREAAVSVLEEKKAQNLNAILAKFPRNQLSYALVFEALFVPESEAKKAAEADYRKNFDSVEVRPCEGVATARQNP